MPKFYIKVPHESEEIACLKAIKILKETGSHFLTNAEFGCLDGDHSARIIVELDSKEEALMVIPRAYRDRAHIVELRNFSMEEIDQMMAQHTGEDS